MYLGTTLEVKPITKINSIPYYGEVRDPLNGFVYSVDNLRISFEVSPRHTSDMSAFLLALRSDIESYPKSTKAFSYQHLFVFRYGTDASMTVAYGFNGTNPRTDIYKGYLDVNTNKTGSIGQFWADYRMLKSFCLDGGEWKILRCDIAVDIPADRSNVFLKKDQRKYALEAYSPDNKTEYLGRRSNVGYVKLYNKTLERNLPYSCTRYEVTCEPSVGSFFANAAEVYNLEYDEQVTLELHALDQTQRTILEMEWKLLANDLDPGFITFNSLSRKIKDKLRPFVQSELARVSFNKSLVTKLIDNYLKIL